jgi:hypothetical protein
MIPDHMPSMDDPVVLELVLCLLEAQGDKFSQLTEKPADVLPYTMVRRRRGDDHTLSLYLFVSVDIYILSDRFDVKGIPLYPTIYLCIQPIIYLYPSIHSS